MGDDFKQRGGIRGGSMTAALSFSVYCKTAVYLASNIPETRRWWNDCEMKWLRGWDKRWRGLTRSTRQAALSIPSCQPAPPPPWNQKRGETETEQKKRSERPCGSQRGRWIDREKEIWPWTSVGNLTPPLCLLSVVSCCRGLGFNGKLNYKSEVCYEVDGCWLVLLGVILKEHYHCFSLPGHCSVDIKDN